jgi:hypothetical protein
MRRFLSSFTPVVLALSLMAVTVPVASAQVGRASGRVVNTTGVKTTAKLSNDYVARVLRDGVVSYINTHYAGYVSQFAIGNFHTVHGYMKMAQFELFDPAYRGNFYGGWMDGCGRVYISGSYVYYFAQWYY